MKDFSTHLSETIDSLDEPTQDIATQKATATNQRYFYENENRNEILSKITHLIDYTKLVLFIQGENGLGKTSIAKQCAIQTCENWRTSYISTKECTTEADFIGTIINDFQLSTDTEIKYDASVQVVSQKLKQLKQNEEIAVLIIDDIELLHPTIIPILSALIYHTLDTPPLVRLIILGQNLPGQIQAIIPCEENQATLKHLSLKPFSLNETREYIEFRLKSLNLENHPLFDNSHIMDIHRDSMGIPKKINSLSDELLTELTTSSQTFVQEKSHIKPNRLFATTALLIATGIISLIILMAIPKKSDHEQDLNLIPLDIPNKNHENSTVQSITETLPSTTPESAVIETDHPNSKNSSAEKVVPDIFEEESLADETDHSLTDNSPIDGEKNRPELANEIQVTAQPVGNTELTWFNSQEKNHYTIQLIATSKKEAAQRFIRQYKIEQYAQLLETTRDNKNWFVVLYHTYPTRAEAILSRQSLPEKLRQLKPWIRSFGDLAKHLP